MKCLVCDSERIIKRQTVMSEFLTARISGDDLNQNQEKVNLCHCEDCTFSFYDRRLTDKESSLLYKDYRGAEYQKQREKYDCWYTEKVNNAMNTDKMALSEQRRVIDKLIKSNIHSELEIALDYGGNQGESFTALTGTKEKYVYDISGVETVGGVKNIRNYSELFNYEFDFIMCNMTLEHVSYPKDLMKQLFDIGCEKTFYYLEVPSENPFEKNKFSIRKNLELLINPIYSNIRLVKHYIHLRNKPYMQMTEHINFYTPKSIKILCEKSGFDVLDVQENREKACLGNIKVLSVVCKKKQ
jgi:hypothetical protein